MLPPADRLPIPAQLPHWLEQPQEAWPRGDPVKNFKDGQLRLLVNYIPAVGDE